MKKLAYFCSIFVAIFAINACESDSRLADPSEAAYDELSMEKAILPDAVAKNGVAPCSQETAWAGCNFYNGGWNNSTRGNWALYTSYTGEIKWIDLVAGQNLIAGSVQLVPMSGEDKITIRIRLAEGWCLQPVEEPVKIQDYATTPTGNPKVGHFAYKKISAFVDGWYEVIVPRNNFYGIHVDVGCCD